MKYLIILFVLITISLSAKLSYEIKEFSNGLKDYPSFSFIPDKRVDKLKITIKKDKKRFLIKNYKNIPSDKKKTIILKQKAGEHNYEISINGSHFDGEIIKDDFEMKGIRVKPLKLFFKAEDVDVGNRNIVFSASRNIEKIEVKIYNTMKKLAYENTITVQPPSKDNLTVTWPKINDEILTIHIQAYDKWNYWSGMDVNPFKVNIPHKEIDFASGKWNISEKEMPKMRESYKKVTEALKKYGKALKLKLYIAGYTDTVGSKSSNLILSEKRARSIALAFRKLGLNIPVYYQGFGENVLKKATKDEVDEPLNRRAIYILSSQSPVISKTIPDDKWKKLK
jgi:outer membrane protein OmpA-like peptidoglycan-associated protein